MFFALPLTIAKKCPKLQILDEQLVDSSLGKKKKKEKKTTNAVESLSSEFSQIKYFESQWLGAQKIQP